MSVNEAKQAVDKQDWPRGEQLWTKLVESNPNDPKRWNGLGFVYEQTGRLAEALAVAEKALMAASSDPNYKDIAGVLLPKVCRLFFVDSDLILFGFVE